jgi:hypothetical protein
MPYLPDLHIDQFLTTISVAYTNQMLVGDDVFPVVPVDKLSDVYAIYGQESFKAYEDTRAPGTDALEVTYTLTRGTYLAAEHTLRTKVPDQYNRQADNPPLDPLVDATWQLTETVTNQREFRQMNVAADPTQVTQNVALSGTSLWSDYTNSTPLTNIRTARSVVRAGIHREATDFLLAYDAALTLVDHPSIKDELKYTDPNSLQTPGLPATIRGLTTHISGADKDTAAYLSGTTNFMPVFSKAGLVYYRNPNLGLRSMTFGVTFDAPDQTTGARGMQIRRWYDEWKQATWVQGSRTYVVKIIAPLGGYLFAPCIA